MKLLWEMNPWPESSLCRIYSALGPWLQSFMNLEKRLLISRLWMFCGSGSGSVSMEYD